ncbi:hypothetical protein BDN72DRAFT_832972 [Pluteus cervinus]|uniref:Uncharacterized protein n=1 Tax=Pluteus cervinus TaxID=181527 RepID=A0ACD3BA26_9AGAR|nr:hypothetical protein BDN72DRAFT_832972 [Pluteus cervinus]
MPRAKRARVDHSPESDRGTTPGSAAEAKRVRWGGSQGADDDTRPSDDEDASSDRTQQVVLTAWCQHGRLGCAYYDPVRYMIYLLEDTQESAHFDLTAMLLEQANPDIALTSSKSDEDFIEVFRDRVEAAGGICQIRPFKEFTTGKGRDRLLSLRLLTDLAYDEPDLGDDHSSSVTSRRQNAYNFMRNRREVQGDPLAKRWNAAIRLSNFISAESAPLCVILIFWLCSLCAVDDLIVGPLH